MTGWSVDVLGMTDAPHDSRDIRCTDVGELAKVVAAGAALSGARVVHIRRLSAPDDTSIEDAFAGIPMTERLVAVPVTPSEVALAQWEARWHTLMMTLAASQGELAVSSVITLMNDIAERTPVGLPPRSAEGGS